MAQAADGAELGESRRGIDETEQGVALKLSVIKADLARGLSPAQIAAARAGELALSASTIYRWVEAGYGGVTGMGLRRKVGYRPRRHAGPRRATQHSGRGSHAEFTALPEGVRASCWGMGAAEGPRAGSARPPALPHRPSRLRLAPPVPDGTRASVPSAPALVRAAPGDGTRRAFALALTDDGSESADEGAIAAAPGERGGETRLYFCTDNRHRASDLMTGLGLVA